MFKKKKIPARKPASRKTYSAKKKPAKQSSAGKSQRKWNRVRVWSKMKPTKNKKAHPAYIFGRSGRLRKHLIFTHSSTTDGKDNIRLDHNIDPSEVGKDSYVRPISFISHDDDFDPPDKKYRIHYEDLPKINSIKKKK